MRKNYMFLFVAIAFVALSVGCQGFKGFCDRGSLFPTRQPQLVPQQALYSATYDTCCETVVGACDPCATPCANGSMGGGVYPNPVMINN